jgi:hypothetical protein
MELTYFELLQMVDVSINRLESVFQFWLSATFAVIVASHLTGDKLTKIYAGMLSSLYLVFTFSVIVRMIAWRDTLQSYFAALSAIRSEQGGAGMMSLVNNSIWATVLLGTIATVVFIWHSYLTSKQDLGSASNGEPAGSHSEPTL